MRSGKPHLRERTLRLTQTEAQHVVWQHLRDRLLNGFKFRRQHRIGPYFADFACVEALLIVELDGSQHLEQTQYDSARTSFLQANGYRVARFCNDDVLIRPKNVLEAISNLVQPPTRPSGTLSPSSRGEGRAMAPEIATDHPTPHTRSR